MTNLPTSFKDDLKAIYKELLQVIKIAIQGDATKLKEFPRRYLIDRATEESGNLRLYMFNPDNELVMIVPEIDDKTLYDAFIPAILTSSLDEKDRIKGMQELASIGKKLIQKKRDGEFELIDIFTIFVFTGKYLLTMTDVDSTAAVRISLALAQDNVYDYLKDYQDVSAVITEVLEELELEGF